MPGQLIAGHQRIKIMQLIGQGDELIDVRVPDRQLTKKDAEEYLIRSNKNTGSWDWDILANIFDSDDLLEWGFTKLELGIDDIDYVAGHGEKEIDENIETENECPNCGYKW